MGCTVEELLARTTSRELTEWEAYESVTGPVTEGERLDILFAALQTTIANANRGKKQRPYKAEQFMPKWDQPKAQSSEPMSGEDMLAAVKKMNRKMGGA